MITRILAPHLLEETGMWWKVESASYERLLGVVRAEHDPFMVGLSLGDIFEIVDNVPEESSEENFVPFSLALAELYDPAGYELDLLQLFFGKLSGKFSSDEPVTREDIINLE